MTVPAFRPGRWSEEDAERYLLGLELFGMRFGLDRMRRLLTTLGSPQERFGSIHVVGTNGKSSTVRMIAAILERHGERTGAYLSPHLVAFTERIRIRERDIEAPAFGDAVQIAARAATKVDHTLQAGDRVTQFEALTAAALWELAQREIDVGVIEAGLGGRWDATNVLPSKVAVLTNVGLEHTRWLGPTVTDIAREKLAVLRPGTTLVVGAGLHADAMVEAEAAVAAAGARLVVAGADPGVPLGARGDFQRRNFALARAAAEAYLYPPTALDEEAVRAAAAGTLVPGRFQEISDDPPTVLDGAHNPGGLEALTASLPSYLDGRPLTAVLSILDDKDATAMLRELLPHVARLIVTRSGNPRALSPATLESLAHQLGSVEVSAAGDPHAALELARGLAAAEGGVVLATGSIYLVADLLRPPGARQGATL
jgi:dihydrofolate synthase / folylpolyglutamate synthase